MSILHDCGSRVCTVVTLC